MFCSISCSKMKLHDKKKISSSAVQCSADLQELAVPKLTRELLVNVTHSCLTNLILSL